MELAILHMPHQSVHHVHHQSIVRLLLAYTGTKFVDTKYQVTGTAPNFDKSCWFDIKFSLGLDFPNLPYFKDGQVTIRSLQ